jgi:hypothetical protein
MRFRLITVLATVVCLVGPVGIDGAEERIYGLESAKFERIFDPDALPQRLLLVSGTLKLVGGHQRGNVWEAVTYIPQRAAAPRSDYGIFTTAGDRILFYSLVSFTSYAGTVRGGGERIEIQKINRNGQSQTEIWYLER